MDVVRLHGVWRLMHRRCTDPRSRNYEWYGGKGIAVDPKWDDFDAFAEWSFDKGYAEGLQLDRKNCGWDYTPTNCRWVTRTENMRNTTRSVLVGAFGETKCLSEWVEDERFSVGYMTLHARIKRGWDPERALTETPKYTRKAV
jgi:hypothetical protein